MNIAAAASPTNNTPAGNSIDSAKTELTAPRRCGGSWPVEPSTSPPAIPRTDIRETTIAATAALPRTDPISRVVL
jgi:hypothetical protein